MRTLRLVYPEELVALQRLFFLTEDRNMQCEDYELDDGYIRITAPISKELDDFLAPYERQTVWAPLWIQSSARHLIRLTNIPCHKSLYSVVFIDRNYYELGVRFATVAEKSRELYIGDIDKTRLIACFTPKYATWTSDFYKIPDAFAPLGPLAFESYLFGKDYYILPYSTHPEKRPCADLGWAVPIRNGYGLLEDRTLSTSSTSTNIAQHVSL